MYMTILSILFTDMAINRVHSIVQVNFLCLVMLKAFKLEDYFFLQKM